MEILKRAAGTYLGIGACLLAVQMVTADGNDPACLYGSRPVLIERTFPKRTQLEELQATLKGEPRRHGLLSIGRHVAGWLPDVYSYVLAGDMSAKAFLKGGVTCIEPVRR
jgi:hypothetical protein